MNNHKKIFLLLGAAAATAAFPGRPSSAGVPDALRFEPSWREPTDCGRLALLALMKLKGYEASIEDVKDHVKIDPTNGCSLEDIRQAGNALGFATEVRYVNAARVKDLPRPFILHGISSIEKNLGHFIVVVGYTPEKKTYSWIDTDTQKLKTNPDEAVLRGYSGYILLPVDRSTGSAEKVFGYVWLGIGCTLFTVWGMRTFPRRVIPQAAATTS